jgi:hypothetical protein
MQDNKVKSCAEVFAGERIKVERDKEILASVGFKDTYIDGYQLLGNPRDAEAALKLRYLGETGGPSSPLTNPGAFPRGQL